MPQVFGPPPAGQATLLGPADSDHAQKVNFHLRGPGIVLAPEDCRERLLHSRSGFLACTSRALPTVVPASLSVRHGQLLVTVHDQVLADQLVGQVVALGIGRRSLPFRRGWRVMARGQLGPRDVSGTCSLPMEPYQIEGVREGRAPRTLAEHPTAWEVTP